MMIVCVVLDGVMKRQLGYSGNASGGPARSGVAVRGGRSVSISFKHQKFHSSQRETEKATRSSSIPRIPRLVEFTKVIVSLAFDAPRCIGGRVRGYSRRAVGPAWWAAPRAAPCTRPRSPAARTAWRARSAAAWPCARACPARPPAPASPFGRCKGTNRLHLCTWKQHKYY